MQNKKLPDPESQKERLLFVSIPIISKGIVEKGILEINRVEKNKAKRIQTTLLGTRGANIGVRAHFRHVESVSLNVTSLRKSANSMASLISFAYFDQALF